MTTRISSWFRDPVDTDEMQRDADARAGTAYSDIVKKPPRENSNISFAFIEPNAPRSELKHSLMSKKLSSRNESTRDELAALFCQPSLGSAVLSKKGYLGL